MNMKTILGSMQRFVATVIYCQKRNVSLSSTLKLWQQ
jgi:hypothetical protein